MKVAILDDWFDTLRGLPCFAKLDGLDVTVFTDHIADVGALARTAALLLMRLCCFANAPRCVQSCWINCQTLN